MNTFWARTEARVIDVEQEVRAHGATLGPLAVWCKEMSVHEMLASRAGFRCNPAMCRIEDVVSAFAYERDGGVHRTSSAPREACGPELKQGLYGELASVREVELRLLPASEEIWLRVGARETADIHGYVRSLVRDGIAPRALWTEMASGWLCFAGAMRSAYHRVADARARERGIETQSSSAPTGSALSSGFVPAVKTWETLGPRDSIVLADPWAVLAR